MGEEQATLGSGLWNMALEGESGKEKRGCSVKRHGATWNDIPWKPAESVAAVLRCGAGRALGLKQWEIAGRPARPLAVKQPSGFTAAFPDEGSWV